MVLRSIRSVIRRQLHLQASLNTRRHISGLLHASPKRRRHYLTSGLALGFAATSAFVLVHSDDEDRPESDVTKENGWDPLSRFTASQISRSTTHLESQSLQSLCRSYFVYLFSSSSTLVDLAPVLERNITRFRDVVPLLGPAAYWFFRQTILSTFFPVFVGGETVKDADPLMQRLLAAGCGSLLCYSVEAEDASQDSAGALHEDFVDRTHSAISVAGKFPSDFPHNDYPRPTWCAIKLSGLLKDPSVLERASDALISSSSYQRGTISSSAPLFPPAPNLSEKDEEALSALYAALQSLCHTAQQHRVRIDLDAEQSWFQPAIDRYFSLLAPEYNLPTLPATVYNTYQTYRTDTHTRLQAALEASHSGGYSFGAKLVRGAYMDSERARAHHLGKESPIHATKGETDECFDLCAGVMTQALAQGLKGEKGRSVSVMYASHNVESVRKALEGLVKEGVVEVEAGKLVFSDAVRTRVAFGQLLGMADALTATLLDVIKQPNNSRTCFLPVVVKYVPWGDLEKTLPYLIRRAQENKSVLQPGGTTSGAKAERIAVGKEIRKRLHLPSVIHLI